MRLLVGLDKREGGADALELARLLANGEDASALVASVLYTGPLSLDYAALTEEQAEEAEPLFAAANERLAGLAVQARAYGGGSPARILTKLAEKNGYDAVVVGSPHRGPLGRAMIGSVANSLLNGSPADVAIAPRGFAQERHGPPRTIAVGYDGTLEAKAALHRAEALARRFGASLRLITVVVPPVAAPVMVPGVYSPQLPPMPEQVIADGIDSVDPALDPTSQRFDGDPARELIRASEDGIDLLVLGSRGYGPISRVLLGSVSRPVADSAACPVIVVKRP